MDLDCFFQFLDAMALPVGAPGVGAPGLDPTTDELIQIIDLDSALAWPGISPALKRALFEALGTSTTLRTSLSLRL